MLKVYPSTSTVPLICGLDISALLVFLIVPLIYTNSLSSALFGPDVYVIFPVFIDCCISSAISAVSTVISAKSSVIVLPTATGSAFATVS